MEPLTAAYAAVFLGFFLPRAWYSRRARRTSERERTAHEDPGRLRVLRALGGLGLLGTLLFLVQPQALGALALPLPAWLRWLGVGLGAAAVALFVWTHRALGAEWSVRLRVREGGALVMRGPYAWVRHPMYAAALLWGAALVLASANAAAGVPWLALAVAAAARVREEERVLEQAHGGAYRAYAGRTGRFLPRLRRPPAPQT